MKKAGDILYKAECVVAGFAFVVMVGVIVFNVIARYIMHSSFAWAEEISYLGFNWAVFFGICVVYRNQGLISIDVLVDHLPKKVQNVVQIATFAVVGLANIALVVWGMQLAIQGWARTTAALAIPYFWMYVEIPIACFVLMLYSFHNCYICLRGGNVEAAALEDRT